MSNKPEFCNECDCLLIAKISDNTINKGDFHLCNDCLEIYRAKTDDCKVYVCEGCDDYINEDKKGEEQGFCFECSQGPEPYFYEGDRAE